MSAGPRRWRVTCDAPGPYRYGAGAHCSFDGYRTADSMQEAGTKPCPRCGGPVQVTPQAVTSCR